MNSVKNFKVTIYLFFLLTILVPVFRLILFFIGIGFNTKYIIEFSYALIYEIILAIISIKVLIIFCVNEFKVKDNISFKENISNNRAIQIVLFLNCPLSFINSIFIFAYGPETRWQILFLLIYSSCCLATTLFFSRPIALKIISLVISLLPAGIMWLYCFIAFIFIGFTSRTVMNTIDLPIFPAECHNSVQNISTQHLTVLTICAIMSSEQRKEKMIESKHSILCSNIKE